MKSNETLNLFDRAALAVLFVQLIANLAHGGAAVKIGQNFTGSTDSFAYYPNPSGAVGEDYFVEFNSDYFVVYNKSNGSVVQSLGWDQFWSNAGVPIPNSGGHGTGYVIYDPAAQRWFVQEMVATNTASLTSHQFQLAVSETADPTGAWNAFAVPNNPGAANHSISSTTFGLDATGVYACTLVKPPTSSYKPIGCGLLSLPKADLLLIPPVTTNLTWFSYLDSTNYGYALQPAVCLDGSASGAVLATGGTGEDALGDDITNNTLVALAVVNSGGPSSVTIGAPQTIVVPPYTSPNNALQSDGTSNLVTGGAMFTAHVPCVGGVLFAAQPLQYGPHTAIRWYRVSAASHLLLESSTISDPTLDLYYPSIAANTNGTVVLAFNGSGTNTFVSCYAIVGQTINGTTTFGNRLLLKAGLASYQNLNGGGNDLWGLYSTTCVDPIDPNVFWTINAYAAGPTTWATQITQILTSPSPQLSVANTGVGLLLSWPVTAVPFQLESAPNFPGGNGWMPVSQSATTNGAIVSVVMPATNSTAFFRLVQAQ